MILSSAVSGDAGAAPRSRGEWNVVQWSISLGSHSQGEVAKDVPWVARSALNRRPPLAVLAALNA